MQATKEQIRIRFENYIREYEDKITLWKKVTVVTKKDGTEFKDFGKNFTNCRVYRPAYSFGDLNIEVSGYVNNEYRKDEINTRELVKYSNFKPEDSRIINEAYLEPYFYLTIPEIMEKIQYTIGKYQACIQEYKDYIEKLDALYDIVINGVNSLMDTIKREAGDHNSLYYEMRELIQNVGY